MGAKGLVLLSGGQDSATCLAIALSDMDEVQAVCFDYGQRHKIEIDQAKKLADMAGVSFELVRLSLLSDLTDNALTRHDQPIDDGDEARLPSTFVPGRNHLFLSVAAIIAYTRQMTHLYTGVCQTDYSGYPDCRDDFIKSFEQTINLAMDSQLVIKTPLMWLTKAETVLKMNELGRLDWYRETHTCYEGKRPPCGRCPACVLRARGFAEAEIPDPLLQE